jgi:hypothetical protein
MRTKKQVTRGIVVSHETLLRLIAAKGRIDAAPAVVPEEPPAAPPARFVVVPTWPVRVA